MEAMVERRYFGAGLLILRHRWPSKESNAADYEGPGFGSVEVLRCI